MKNQINGKCFNVIYNLYKDNKSKVTTQQGSSNYFTCNVDVRQGENLSPFLFSIFLNDLEMYLNNDNVSGIICDVTNDELIIFLKVLILLYADDAVSFSDKESGLQYGLNVHVFEKNCSQWKLTVNVSKPKVVVFGSGRRKENLKFYLNSMEIEIVQEYKYLSILLGQSGSFVVTKKHIADQANKALFSLLRKIRKLSLPFDIQIDLFNKMIKPML